MLTAKLFLEKSKSHLEVADYPALGKVNGQFVRSSLINVARQLFFSFFFIEMKVRTSSSVNLTETSTTSDRTYMEDSRAKIQPLVEKVQAEATKLQEQVKPYITNIEDQIKPLTNNFNAQVKPLTDNFHAQVQPLADMMEKFFKQVMDQTKALLPPQ